MKSVTEFWGAVLLQGLKAKEALAAEGKTPEEIQTNLGEKFKLEGDKLKYFTNALEVAGQNQEKLHKVKVLSLAEGETAPQKSTKIEEHHYVPDFVKAPAAIVKEKVVVKKGGQGKGSGDRTKTSPWGLTPEEKAKKGGAKKA